MKTSVSVPVAECAHCGHAFIKIKADGGIPTHDYPPPCRSVCPGSGKQPRADKDTPLYKDKPEQESIDFWEQARMELRLYGFAVAKQMALLLNRSSGTMECPLCQQDMKFSISSGNGHFRACCSTSKCIDAME